MEISTTKPGVLPGCEGKYLVRAKKLLRKKPSE
jgi:hypothetical protein